jgi:RNA polymerase sigma-70 factor (ECF subfamily)
MYESDLEIIYDYCVNCNDRAATAFVRRHQNFVYATALRYLKNEGDADEAAQEVFIKALKGLKNFRGKSKITTWLYRITINVCTNMSRKKKVRSIFRSFEKDDLPNMASSELSPDMQLENKEFQKKFLDSLDKLPKKQRETFALRYFDKLKYSEISEMLGTSTGGLKANYYQATKKLAILLRDEV